MPERLLSIQSRYRTTGTKELHETRKVWVLVAGGESPNETLHLRYSITESNGDTGKVNVVERIHRISTGNLIKLIEEHGTLDE